MEFREFMDEVRKALGQMGTHEMTNILLEMARITPKEEREDFLKIFEATEDKVAFDFEEAEIWCQKIEEQRLYFDTEEEEYYEEGAWESDYRTYYLDTMKIIPRLNDMLDDLHQMVFQKEYEKAYKMLQRICGLSFLANSDWFDARELSLWELMDEKVLLRDENEIKKDLLYSVCQIEKPDDRPEKLYQLLNQDWACDISLTDIFSYGPEAIYEEEDFAVTWIGYLRKQSEHRAAVLLEEACIYVGGISLLRKTAMDEGEKHPYLLKALCGRYVDKELWRECLDSVVKGLELVPKQLMIRGEIADYGIIACLHLKENEWERKLVVEAFLSQPTGGHFIRLFSCCQSEDLPKVLKCVRDISVKEESYFSWKNSQKARSEKEYTHIISKRHKQLYQVMLGDFEEGYENCLNDKKYLGWTSSFQGVFVPLMLLYFRKNGSVIRTADSGLKVFVRKNLGVLETEEKLFEICFKKWKEIYALSEAQQTKCLEMLRNKVEKRTNALVGGGYRHSYYKAAQLIVVLGEVEDERSTGHQGATELAEYYRKQNSRKRAFRTELEECLKVISDT